MSVWFVTRHPGAVEWARRRGLDVDHWVPHLEPGQVRRGDVVAGTLPVHLAAQVCARGARYLHLQLELPLHRRGQELSADELDAAGARLHGYEILTACHDKNPP